MGFLLHPIRTLMLVGGAFLAGVFYEKYETHQRCILAGGQVQEGVCR
ncbi:hypothetical protein [Primorskyibacter sp. S187A]